MPASHIQPLALMAALAWLARGRNSRSYFMGLGGWVRPVGIVVVAALLLHCVVLSPSEEMASDSEPHTAAVLLPNGWELPKPQQLFACNAPPTPPVPPNASADADAEVD